MIIRLLCGIIALLMTAGVTAKAAEPVGLELRKRSAIGGWGVVRIQLTVKVQTDGSILASFHAPEAGSYALFFTNGPEAGKLGMIVRVAKGGPVTAKLRPRRR